MRFYLPTDIYTEKNCVANHAKDILALGKKAFIMTGKHSAKVNGSLDDVLSVLKNGGIDFDLFDKVEENPSVETIQEAADQAKAFGADYVIGIGGGSPVDAAKAVAILVKNPEEEAYGLYQDKGLKHCPVLAIPTTCGTGTEATPVSVLTNHKMGTKKSIPYKIYPTLSLVDGRYLMAAKKELIVNTAVDALAHAVESYLNVKSNTFNRMFPEYAFRLWGQNLPALLGEKEMDEDTCEMLMMASTAAGMAITHTGTALPHGMSYELTYNHGVPHGKACGFFLASYMTVCAKKGNEEDVARILSLIGIKDMEEFTSLIRTLNGTFTISREACESYIQSLSQNQGKLAAVPGIVDIEDVRYMFEFSLTVE